MFPTSAVCAVALAVTHCFCYIPAPPIWPDRIAAIILALMSVCLIVAIKRALGYAIAEFSSDRLKREVEEAVRLSGIEAALNVCGRRSKNQLTVLIRAALAEIKRASSIDQRELERVREGFSRVCCVEIASLKRDMTLLKAIGQTAVLIGFAAAAFDISAVLDDLCDIEGGYAADLAYAAAAGAKIAVAGMLISVVAIWTYRFICFRIESAAAQADQLFFELAGSYSRHRTRIEGIERIQRNGLKLWESCENDANQ